MKDIMSFLTTGELLIVYGLVAFTTVVFLIMQLTYNKRKKKQNTKELNKLATEVQEKLEEDKTAQAVHESIKNEKLEPVPEIINNEKEENMEIIEEIPLRFDNPSNEVKQGVLTPTIEIDNIDIEPVEEILDEKPQLNTIQEEPVTDFLDQVEEIEVLDDFEPKIINEPAPKEEILEEIKKDNIDEDIEYEEEMNQTKAQEEIEKLTKELVQANNTVENIDLTNFEEEQEKNAIISLDEFLKLGDQLYDKNEVTQYEDEGNEPISLQDLEARKNESVVNIDENNTNEIEIEDLEKTKEQVSLKLDDFYSIKDENKKFEKSPVISPVYGIEKNPSENDMELENTANYEKLDEEIRKTNEFLSTLRELQEKLQ